MSCSKGYRITTGLPKEEQYQEIRRGLDTYVKIYEGLDLVARMAALNVYIKVRIAEFMKSYFM
jgi:hypothetical protein